MTQEDVAHGLRQQGFKATAKSISRWENGDNDPRASVIPVLADVLGTSIDDLYTDDEDEDSDAADQPTTAELLDALQPFALLLEKARHTETRSVTA